jgi:DNA ligase (NAD+)
MKKKEFQRLNEELKTKNLSLLANPRNAAAGTLRTLNPVQKRNLHFFAYQILGVKEINNQLNCLEKLSQEGFAVNPHYCLCQNLAEIQKYFQEIQAQRDSLDYEIDGIVVKINNYDYHQKLGQTSRFPRWALAYKFPASIALSQIKDIQIEITRSGRVSYVAQITPVNLLGSQINKSTLHNYGFIRNLNLNIGDQVVIKKAGDIIPQVIQVIKSDSKQPNACWSPPVNCPSCFAALE